MDFLESIRIATRGLSANKLRSVLTMLGIIIGVGAVITLLSVGQGVERLVTGSLQSIGSNLLFIVPGRIESAGPGGRPVSSGELTNRDVEAIADPFLVPDVIGVAPEAQGGVQLEYGRTVIRTTLSGVLPDYPYIRNSAVAFGEFIGQEHVAGNSRVVVVGSQVAARLFPDYIYPVGETIKVNRLPFRVIGIMQEKGGTGFGSEDNQVFVPLTTAQQRLLPRLRSRTGEPLVSVIYAQVISEDRMEAAAEQITELLRERHGIRYADEDDFTVVNQADLISIFGQITGVLTLFLGAIAAISLLVGGIGIMNIMLVSVTERTREIGIRKAVGAKRRDILAQFLVEAIILSLIGGAIGIGLGIAGAMLVGNLQADLVPVVTPQSILLATGFSALVGLFFGIYPATRAARLNPIDALRYE
jgi:putative ABC transport system permease protein